MKKTLWLCAICMVGFTIQSHAQASFSLGIKGGLNFANVDTDASAGETYDSRTGYHAGAFATLKFSKLAIQPEIILSKQGSKVSFDGDDLESNFSYINIPVLLKFYLIGGLNLQVGPQFGFVASAEREIEPGDFDDIKNELKGSDISAALGAGFDLPFGLTIDARYNLGLTDINDQEAANEAKNQVFQVSLGYRFINLGK